MTDAVAIYWKDHYSETGWHDAGEVRPHGHINISVGIPVLHNHDEDYCTIAQTMYEDGTVYGDLLHVLKKDIIKIIVLQEEEEIEDLTD